MISIEIPWLKEWPNCYYNNKYPCGHPAVDNHPGLPQGSDWKPENQSWHVAGLCECPSCPIRCAIRTELFKREKETDGS